VERRVSGPAMNLGTRLTTRSSLRIQKEGH
jgi:hypothetical protein